jgi:enamine deaminase RidA (YjgF/YER057c/UK114 family)
VALDQEGKLVGAGNPTAQADQAFKNLAAAVRAAGAEPANIIKLTTFVTDMAYLPHVREARDRHLDRANPPASTLIGVTALFRPEFLIEVEAVAVR